jgi:hypothetical protein
MIHQSSTEKEQEISAIYSKESKSMEKIETPGSSKMSIKEEEPVADAETPRESNKERLTSERLQSGEMLEVAEEEGEEEEEAELLQELVGEGEGFEGSHKEFEEGPKGSDEGHKEFDVEYEEELGEEEQEVLEHTILLEPSLKESPEISSLEEIPLAEESDEGVQNLLGLRDVYMTSEEYLRKLDFQLEEFTLDNLNPENLNKLLADHMHMKTLIEFLTAQINTLADFAGKLLFLYFHFIFSSRSLEARQLESKCCDIK